MAYEKSSYDKAYSEKNIIIKTVAYNRKNPRDMAILKWAKDNYIRLGTLSKRLLYEYMQGNITLSDEHKPGEEEGE